MLFRKQSSSREPDTLREERSYETNQIYQCATLSVDWNSQAMEPPAVFSISFGGRGIGYPALWISR